MLVAFDFGGTIATSDPYVRLAERRGEGGEVASILDRAWSGDLDFELALHSVAEHLEGLPEEGVAEAYDHVGIHPAVSELVADLEASDHHVAIVSDAPEEAIRSCREANEFDVDTVVANRLPVEDGALTGEVTGPLVGRSKADALEDLAVSRGRAMTDVVALGTDRRDLPMLQAAGRGIGVDPEPVVRRECDRVAPTVDRLHLWFEEQGVV